MQKVIATYHKDCVDGTTAAAVLLKKFPQARVFPLKHSYSKEDIAPILTLVTPEVACYTLDSGLGVREFLAAGSKVVTIDHHIGAKEEFEAISRENKNYTFVFDNEKSGSSLTWEYLFPNEPLPELVKYVEDVDLWRWKFGDDAKFANNYLSIFRDKPEEIAKLIESDIQEIKKKGEIISLYADKEIENQVQLRPISIKIGQHIVPAYNITTYQSASGNILSSKQNKAVALFMINGDTVRISFRSKDNHSPTSLELATSLGGGGHKNAAGANVLLPEFFKMIS